MTWRWNGQNNYQTPLTQRLPRNEWTNIRIRQYQNEELKYIFAVEIDGVLFTLNYNNVTLMNGAAEYPPAKAFIDNISYNTTDRGDIVEKGRLMKTIPKLYKQFKLAFEVKAKGYNKDPTGLTGILQMGTGGDKD
jgi:hypothetical protein